MSNANQNAALHDDGLFIDGLRKSAIAVHNLQAAGCNVLSIEILYGSRPLIEIDRAPPRDFPLEQATTVYNRTIAGKAFLRYQSCYIGCRINWRATQEKFG